jgi:hypothetical protein
MICGITSHSSLLTAPQTMRDDLTIAYQGQAVKNAHVVTLQISNVGRNAIPSSSFDRNRALIFGVSVPIAKVLTVEHTPPSAPNPVITTTGDQLELQPELIARNEIITISFLAEGPIENVSLIFNPLDNISVDIRDREALLTQWADRRALIMGASGIMAVLIIGLLVAFALSPGGPVANSLIRQRDCQVLKAAAAREATELANLQGSLSIIQQSGRIAGHTPSYRTAYNRALMNIQTVAAAKQRYKSDGARIATDPKITDDLNQMLIDLPNLHQAVSTHGIGGAEWNQLSDYRVDFEQLSQMQCSD